MPDLIEHAVLPARRQVPAKTFQARLQAFLRRLHTRKGLVGLNESQLRDVGLSREEALEEIERPVWRLWGG
ncbi:DUF1127 domain-containing protein [Pseudomonas sp. LRF_L74]|uniref:DUF1127 domain-containing protein n=1 Tax=Pseudomonas sp. LRF_L74 TaxID=3369422 RepID=UPI003F5D5E22